MKPMPSLPPNISPTTTPIRPSDTAWRTPVKMNGTAPGTTTVVKICQSDAQYARAALSRSTSIARTPPIVLINTGNTALMNTMKTFDHIPIPNQISTSGTSATRGVEYSVVTKGSTIIDSRRYQPISTPSTTPTAIAIATPITKLLPLYAMSCFRRPCVHSSMKRVTTDDGPVKKSGEIAFADQSACQTASARTTAVPPRINRSCRW